MKQEPIFLFVKIFSKNIFFINKSPKKELLLIIFFYFLFFIFSK